MGFVVTFDTPMQLYIAFYHPPPLIPPPLNIPPSVFVLLFETTYIDCQGFR